LYDEVLEKTLARAVKRHNFALEDHQLDITGICPKCLLNPKNKPKQAIGGRLRRYILNP
jgi:Fe2+ or Zn2+ uptake regulation protein